MTPTQLRNSILQAAITGCLVPQTESDGTAEQLLQQIENEKRRLIDERNATRIAAARAAGKSDAEIKRIKLEKYTAPEPVNPEDFPFEIPDSWRWVRIGDIFSMQAGKTITASELTDQNKNGFYPCYGGNGLRGYIAKYNNDGEYALVGRQGALCGNINYANGKFWATEHCVVVYPYNKNMTAKFIGLFLQQLNLNQYATSTAQPGLSVQKVLTTFFPLPPLAVQHRIVSKLEELLPLVEEYGSAQGELDALNAALPDKLKKSLLQQAITGNLVAQDPAEGTAEQLLQQIEDEKRRLIDERNAAKIAAARAAGKSDAEIKKIKLEKYTAPKPVNPEDFPFDIPESWRWVRIGDICEVVRGGSPRPAGSPLFYDGNIPFLKVADITKDENIYVEFAENSIKEAGLSKTRLVKSGTLLLTNSGATLGVPKITTFDTTFNDGIAAFLDLKDEIKLYCYYFLKAYTSKFRGINQGTGQPNLNTDIIQLTLLPLPPLAEQRRIVAKLEEMFEEIDRLK